MRVRRNRNCTRSWTKKTLTLEQTRQYARFDAPAFALYDRLARRLDYELLSLVSGMASLQVYLDRFDGRVDRRPLQELDKAAELLEKNPDESVAIKRAFSQACYSILRTARAGRNDEKSRSPADWGVVSRALDMADRMRAAVIKHGLLIDEGGSPPGRTPRRSEFEVPVTIRESLRTTARAAAAISIGALIWGTNGDPSLNGMMVLLAVLTTLFAVGDNPSAGARGFGIGELRAGAAAVVVNFVLLPFVFVAAVAMATPSLALIGRISLVNFALFVHPSNDVRQTFVPFAETFMGSGLAMILALAVYALIFPASARDLLRERLAAMFGELAKGFTGSRERFETRVYDRLLRLPVAADEGKTHVSARQAAFAAVNMGLEARSLRVLTSRAEFSDDTQAAVHRLLAELEALFEQGYPLLDRVFAMQAHAKELARRMLNEALEFTPRQRLRHGVRAAVAAELLAAALADYGMARENADRRQIRLGDVDRAF